MSKCDAFSFFFRAISIGTISLLQLVFMNFSAQPSSCNPPTSEAELQNRDECVAALCCPRPLREQVDLVKAVANALQNAGYHLEESGRPAKSWPINSGIYDPIQDSSFKTAIIDYKKRHAMEQGDQITYEFVSSILGVDLFKRW